MPYDFYKQHGYYPSPPPTLPPEKGPFDGIGAIIPFIYLVGVAVVLLICFAFTFAMAAVIVLVLAIVVYYMCSCWFDIIKDFVKDIKKLVFFMNKEGESKQLVTYP